MRPFLDFDQIPHLRRRQLRRMLESLRFVTTPTSMMLRLTGQETWTDPVALAAGTTVGGVVPSGSSGNTPVTVAAATTTLTLTPALHAGKSLLVQSTGGLAITPPAATGTGDVYRIVCIAVISGGSLTLDAKAGNASDVFTGWMQSYKATTFTPYPTASNSNLITFNGTTTGGAAIGDWFEIRDIALHEWLVTGYTIQSGSIATMFSNH